VEIRYGRLEKIKVFTSSNQKPYKYFTEVGWKFLDQLMAVLLEKPAMNSLNQPSKIAQKRYHPAIIHSLSEIDREHKTALCTACGYTEIHVARSSTGQPTTIVCIRRFQEIADYHRKISLEKARRKPGWKPQHRLSEINTEKKTGICVVCGPTKIYKHIAQGVTYYLCARRLRAANSKYQRARYISSRISDPTAHILSQIDWENKTAVCSLCGPVEIYVWQGKGRTCRRCSNASVQQVPGARKIRRDIHLNLISQFKADRGCKGCGYNENHLMLNLFSEDKGKVQVKVEKLLKLNREDLLGALNNSEVLCVTCSTPRPGHHLENIDQEQRTAICSTCGRTEIIIVRNQNYPHRKPMIYCRTKMREKNGTGVRRYRVKKRLQDPNWKPKHKISQIDLKTMRGVCAICGPTDILKNTIHKEKDTFYRCATAFRKQARESAPLRSQSIKAQKVQSGVVGD
jgi:hypothetical protein